MLGVLAEFERSIIQERTLPALPGLAEGTRSGKSIGRARIDRPGKRPLGRCWRAAKAS
jgi:DNA invertase Pin-like site-specific DNA recombinase